MQVTASEDGSLCGELEHAYAVKLHLIMCILGGKDLTHTASNCQATQLSKASMVGAPVSIGNT